MLSLSTSSDLINLALIIAGLVLFVMAIRVERRNIESTGDQTFRSLAGTPDAFNFSIPDDWTFKQVAEAIVQQENALAKFIGFEEKELQAPLISTAIDTKSPIEALSELGLLTKKATIPKYNVEKIGHIYHFQVIN